MKTAFSSFKGISGGTHISFFFFIMTPEEIVGQINQDMFMDPPITVESYQTVSKFTMLWAIYEGRLFGADYANSKMTEYVKNGKIRLASFVAPWLYFRERYLKNETEANDTFSQLSFRTNPKTGVSRDENRLREIITSGTEEEKEITEAILLIIHRLRNNLFHGIKKVASYNLQRENLERANGVLEDILRHTYLHFLDRR